jgi:hypothetical protein
VNERIEETAAPAPDRVDVEAARTDAVHTGPTENAEPIATGLATAEPTEPEPAMTGPSAAEPATAEPATAEPTEAEPAAAEPATAEPAAAEPAAAEPTTAEPTTAEPTTAEPTTTAPAAVADEEPAPAAEVRDGNRGSRGELHLADDIQFSDLDPEARRELRSLTKSTAETVGRHLVAAGRLIDEDPELALAHARFARVRAARVAVVREAAGLAAYHAGEWAEALGELRAVRRMSGGQAHLPVMADCERALGRPERALELAAEATDLPKDVAIELKIVTAGARRDMGQLDAAVVALQGPDLDPKLRDPWSPRLFYAYADNLEAAGRTDDAIRWFLNAAEADVDEETDAAERAFELRERE